MLIQPHGNKVAAGSRVRQPKRKLWKGNGKRALRGSPETTASLLKGQQA
jgi:hypothetical protein